eukprot:TRINITY_DN168598_c0_g1_i1.p1 TRINITY_DN168598_c0_g1~~TRINITY_DN168598_c0_g1_i1.p1  ORF type:complete len:250 (-),score=45.05 TRINITY_DN168598_c0_g1_i1:63-812(-)
MAAQEMFEPRILNGQGKRTTLLLPQDGGVYPIIAHDAKSDRQPHCSVPQHARIQRGERPMHQSTLTLAKPPWEADYTTTAKQFHGGSKTLEAENRPLPCRSMHRSQFNFGGYGGHGTYPGYPGHEMEHPDVWKSQYTNTHFEKDIVPANRLHLTSLVNRINQTEGVKMKEVVKPSSEQPMNYFTQYKRVHDKLGILRGPGVERGHPIREQYNTITGEEMGLAWKEENHRTSGNRVLHNIRSAMRPPTIQ